MVMRGNTRRPSGTRSDAALDDLARAEGVDRLAAKLIVPSLGRTNPSTVFIVVDLPEALPPRSETISPSRIS